MLLQNILTLHLWIAIYCGEYRTLIYRLHEASELLSNRKKLALENQLQGLFTFSAEKAEKMLKQRLI